MTSTAPSFEAMDIDASDPPASQSPVKRIYTPGQYDTAAAIPPPLVAHVKKWSKSTYKCFDGRGEGDKAEFYILLLNTGEEGWVPKPLPNPDIRRVCAATVQRIHAGWNRAVGETALKEAATPGAASVPLPEAPATPGASIAAGMHEMDIDDTPTRQGHNLRFARRPAVWHRARKNKLVVKEETPPPPAPPNSPQLVNDGSIVCNEPLAHGASHSAGGERCENVDQHMTAPHYHYLGGNEGEIQCGDDGCPSYEDYQVCVECRTSALKHMEWDLKRELEAAAERGVPVGGVPCCWDCGRKKFEDMIAVGRSECVCAGSEHAHWLCAGCTVDGLVFARGLSVTEMERRAEIALGLSCACGEVLGMEALHWECLACGGVVIKDAVRLEASSGPSRSFA